MGKLAKNTAIYAAGDILPKLLNLITFPILTSNLSTGEFGIINYINSIEAFLTIVTFLGLKTYYLVFYYKVGSEEEKKKLLGNISLAVIVFNIILTGLLFAIGSPLFKALGSGDVAFWPYIAIGLLTNFFSILSVLPSALYRVQENPLPLTIINAVKGLLIMVLTCVFVIAYPTSLSVLYVKLFITAIFGFYFIGITWKKAIFKINWSQLKHALLFSLPLVPGDVAYYLSTMSDRILIERYLSVEVLGVYSMAATLAGMLNIIAYGAYKAFEPHFFKTYGTIGFVPSFTKVRDSLLYVLMILSFGLTIFAREIVYIFAKPDYHDAYYFVFPLAIGVIVNTLAIMYTTVLTAQEKTKLCAIVSMVCAVISVVLNIIFIPLIGMWSAAMVNVFVYMLTWLISRYLCGLNVKYALPLKSMCIYLLAAFGLVYLFNISNLLLSLVIKSAAFGLFVLAMSRMYSLNPIIFIRSITHHE